MRVIQKRIPAVLPISVRAYKEGGHLHRVIREDSGWFTMDSRQGKMTVSKRRTSAHLFFAICGGQGMIIASEMSRTSVLQESLGWSARRSRLGGRQAARVLLLSAALQACVVPEGLQIRN